MTRTTRSRLAPALVAATLAAAALPSTGCFGKFGLTRKVAGWNDHVTESKVGKSVVMWGLLVIPVYELAALGDIFIFNPIEFFSGSNPVD